MLQAELLISGVAIVKVGARDTGHGAEVDAGLAVMAQRTLVLLTEGEQVAYTRLVAVEARRAR